MSFMSVPKLLSPAAADSFVINDGKKLYYDLEDLRRSLALEEDEGAFEDDRHDEEHYAEFAPPEHQWYHGVLDRPGAESRLQGQRPGTYLVRESNGKPGSYSLSYLGRHGFDHFRIICVYGQYYIGGRQFESLGDLIGYYTHKSYILIEQKLEYPLPPETRIIETQQDPHEGRPWFFSGLSKQHAMSYVQTHGMVGSFLIRPSEAQGDYSLMVHIGDSTVQRYRIRQDFRFFNIGGKAYRSLDDIIAHYRQCQIAANVYLMDPVVKTEEYITLELGVSKAVQQPNGGVCKEGYLTKKVGHSKKWKEFYFSLKVSERHLLFFESDKSSHPKGLIDLNFCNLYNVHESLHGRSNCFQLVIRSFAEVSSFFLCCQSPEDKEEWMTVLEPLCLNAERFGGQKGSHMEICNIRLTVLDTQKFPKNCSRPYCLISLNDVAVAKTSCLEGSAPPIAWDEDFVFSGLNKEISTLAILILNKHKRVKDSVVGKVSVDLTQLPNRTTTEEWYELKPHDKGSKSKVNLGTLRLRVKYQCDVVLPEGEYLPLKDLLVANDMEAITCLGEVIKDRRSLIGSLMKIFMDCPAGIRVLLSNLAEKEVNSHEDPATLFRSNSVASTAIDEYMKMVAMPFLHGTVKTFVNDIIASNPHCELDPNRLDKGEDIDHNLQNLTKFMGQMLDRVFSSADTIDRALREVFYSLQKLVKERYPDQEAVRTRVVAGFFFLRFVCLALVNPRLFNLVTNQPSERASRTLTLIAKGLQNLASL
eukprot:scpid53072/ scgid4063/ Ras GTPase-activating protein 1; Ras p21 protein activator; p120GAP